MLVVYGIVCARMQLHFHANQAFAKMRNTLSFTLVLICREAETVSEEALAEGLRQMGYQLRPHEMRMLAEQVDPQSQSGAISKSAFLASQLDWQHEDLRQACTRNWKFQDLPRILLRTPKYG